MECTQHVHTTEVVLYRYSRRFMICYNSFGLVFIGKVSFRNAYSVYDPLYTIIPVYAYLLVDASLTCNDNITKRVPVV